MATSNEFIVITRIYDVLIDLGVGVKNTLSEYVIESMLKIENDVCFRVTRDGVKTAATVGDYTLKVFADGKSVRWVGPSTRSEEFYCFNQQRNVTLRKFLVSLSDQPIEADKLLRISEIATALVNEYAEYNSFYTILVVQRRDKLIAAAEARATAAEARASAAENRANHL